MIAAIREVLAALVALVRLAQEVWHVVEPAVRARVEAEVAEQRKRAERARLEAAFARIDGDTDGSGAAVGVGSVVDGVLPAAGVEGAARDLDEQRLGEAAAVLGLSGVPGMDAPRRGDGGDAAGGQ